MCSDRNVKVSVIVPFYSHKDWLDEALESAIKQTYKPYEIIVVNDGSKEDISDIKTKYADQVIFIRQENQGPAVARNNGIDMARGDIVAFLDSDDIWKPEKLEKQTRLMIEDGYQWSATAYETFGVESSEYVVPYFYDGLCWKHIYNACRIGTPTVAVRKELLKSNKFASDMKNGQDTYLWFKLSCDYKLGVLKEPLVKVRIREGSTVKRIDAHIRNRSILWEKMVIQHELKEPKRIFTRTGYKICWYIREKDPEIKDNIKNKLLFGIAWGLFRIDNLILDHLKQERK